MFEIDNIFISIYFTEYFTLPSDSLTVHVHCDRTANNINYYNTIIIINYIFKIIHFFEIFSVDVYLM